MLSILINLDVPIEHVSYYDASTVAQRWFRKSPTPPDLLLPPALDCAHLARPTQTPRGIAAVVTREGEGMESEHGRGRFGPGFQQRAVRRLVRPLPCTLAGQRRAVLASLPAKQVSPVIASLGPMLCLSAPRRQRRADRQTAEAGAEGGGTTQGQRVFLPGVFFDVWMGF